MGEYMRAQPKAIVYSNYLNSKGGGGGNETEKRLHNRGTSGSFALVEKVKIKTWKNKAIVFPFSAAQLSQ